MKKSNYIIFIALSLFVIRIYPSCLDCCSTVYKHQILSYVELNEGMSLEIPNISIIRNTSTFFYFTLLTQDTTDCSSLSFIKSTGGAKDYLYPGTLGIEQKERIRFPFYDQIYNAERYEAMSKEIGDVYDKRFCTGILGTPYPPLVGAVLYNKLDSLKLICINKTIAGHPPRTSLNDIVRIGSSSIKYADGFDSDNPAIYYGCTLQDFYKVTQGGLKYLIIYGRDYWRNSNCSFSPVSPSLIELPPLEDNVPYIFKLYLYLDDGALTIESNEFTVIRSY